MKIKSFVFFAGIFLLYQQFIAAQAVGNEVYSDRKQTEIVPASDFSGKNDVVIDVNALYNAVADEYLAVFCISQLGETAAMANSLMDTRLNGIVQDLKSIGVQPADIYVDMISFVPEYEYETQKKLFSKSYNEIPKGFRLQKNIHIRYKKSKMLDQLITICSKYEVYDLASVKYYSLNAKEYYDTLRSSVKKLIKDRLKEYKELGVISDNAFFQVTENNLVRYPNEQYSSYQAFNSNSMDVLKKGSTVNNVSKTVTYYYNPLSAKGYDIVYNPVISEPVIQYALNMKVKLSMKNPVEDFKNDYYILTPNGELKQLTRGKP